LFLITRIIATEGDKEWKIKEENQETGTLTQFILYTQRKNLRKWF
jgi:hypothetical protein